MLDIRGDSGYVGFDVFVDRGIPCYCVVDMFVFLFVHRISLDIDHVKPHVQIFINFAVMEKIRLFFLFCLKSIFLGKIGQNYFS